jgi:hypothetical protein
MININIQRQPILGGLINQYVCHERGEGLDVGRVP